MMENIHLIAHRGERGKGTENTIQGLKAVADTRADAIEFDIQLTKDKQLVVCHDRSSPRKLYGISKRIREASLADLKSYKTPTGDTMPTLEEVLKIDFSKPLLLDIKDPDSGNVVAQKMKTLKFNKPWMATSLYPEVLTELRNNFTGLEVNLQTHTRPFKTIKLAKSIDTSSVTLVLYLLNPLSYYLARRAGLRVWVYQNYLSFLLSSAIFVRILCFIYPGLGVFSNRPDKLSSIVKT